MHEKRAFAMLATLILALHIGTAHNNVLPCCKAFAGWSSYPLDHVCSSHRSLLIHIPKGLFLTEMRVEKGAIIYNTVPLPRYNKRDMAEEETEKQERAWEMLRNTVITPPELQNPRTPIHPDAAPSSPQLGNRHSR